MPRFAVQSASNDPILDCALRNQSEPCKPSVVVSDTLTGEKLAYCQRHFVERLGRNSEILQALLCYLSERQRREPGVEQEISNSDTGDG